MGAVNGALLPPGHDPPGTSYYWTAVGATATKCNAAAFVGSAVASATWQHQLPDTTGLNATGTKSDLLNTLESATALYTNTQSLPTTEGALLTKLRQTQTTLTFVSAAPVRGRDVVSVFLVNTSTAIFSAIDGSGVCWVASLHETKSPIDGIPFGDSFYGTVVGDDTTLCVASRFAGGALSSTLWKSTFATVPITSVGLAGVNLWGSVAGERARTSSASSPRHRVASPPEARSPLMRRRARNCP